MSSASFSFQIDLLSGTLPGATFPGVGATGTATSNLSASLGAGTAFNGAVTTSIPTSAAPPLTAIQVFVTKNAGGTFVPNPTDLGGNLLFNGTANVYGIGGFTTGGGPLLSIPLNLGTPNTVYQASGGVAITVVSGSWTAGTAAVTGVTTTSPTSNMTNPAGTATAMGSNGLTPGGAGTLVLVSPVKVVSSIAGNFAAFGTLTLNYVPEPGTLLLLVAGIAGIAVLGRG